MTHSKTRFDQGLEKISLYIEKASKHVNPALSLYLQDTRTALFQIEGLCRLYSHMHNGKRFEKIGAKVKELEDLLGKIDYYAAFYKSFSDNEGIPPNIKQYCYDQYSAACKITNEVLNNEGWLDGSRLDDIKEKLKKMDWEKPEQEFTLMRLALSDELREVEKFIKKVLNDLDHIEEDVHEARRKIRWIGIYAQALQGGIILHAKGKSDATLKKYQTADILNSPFNVLAATPNDVKPISFSKPHFYAISYVIKSLGELKDRGLQNHILLEAIQQLAILPSPLAKEQVKSILGKSYQEESEILNAAGSLLQQLIEDKVLDGLMLD